MEILYNGVVLPAAWPPAYLNGESCEPMPVPYLVNRPAIVPIDVGRQLFVDDFLIETTTMTRAFYAAEKSEGNPVLRPETPLETEGALPAACPKSGGVWYDPADKRFKMWYEAGWVKAMAYAVSEDGIHWQRPELDIAPGTNRILPELQPDSTTVWLDHETADPAQRFKMFFRQPDDRRDRTGHCLVSADGIHWNEAARTNLLGDRSTVFYNPFRKQFVYSIRAYNPGPGRGRIRYYHEARDFIGGAQWQSEHAVYWTGADRLDLVDPEIGMTPELYNLDAVGYESIMLGLFEILVGPSNQRCEKGGFPKTTELMTAFSRDGFHWQRPVRTAFIPAARKAEAWDRGYVQSVGGVCLVMDDELWFYYIGFRGDEAVLTKGLHNGMYANASTGIAKLRRDGFASMNAGEIERNLITRPLTFTGRHLFVNADVPDGGLVVEVMDLGRHAIQPFTEVDCVPVRVNSTKHKITWKGGDDLSALVGRPVRFSFNMKRGKLYSFWVSDDESGRSNGYAAGGGPGCERGMC